MTSTIKPVCFYSEVLFSKVHAFLKHSENAGLKTSLSVSISKTVVAQSTYVVLRKWIVILIFFK